MPFSTLKAHYLNDRKLAQLAWLEFARAMRTRRVVAFVGSMATEALGYPSWSDFCASYFDAAQQLVDELKDDDDDDHRHDAVWRALETDRAWATEKIRLLREGASELSKTVAMSLVGEVLDSERLRRWTLRRRATADAWYLDSGQGHLQELSARTAAGFRQPASSPSGVAGGADARDRLQAVDVPKLLFADLDIRRFATTNYDFELERKTMLRDQARWAPESDRAMLSSPFAQLRRIREILARRPTSEVFDWDLGSGRIRRVLTHGKAAESDLLNRERIDRLIEFAIGTDDVDSHIMHLHGRACDWSSMIVTQRDYDRLYRSNDLNRLPFEFARRLMMGGNPMLFVGLGMKEAEVVQDLQEFISNNRYHRTAPAFLLWSAIPTAMTPSDIARMRLDLLHRLGVLTIFDTDLVLTDRQKALREAATKASATKQEAKALGHAAPAGDLLARKEQLETLALSLGAVAKALGTPTRENHIGAKWRSALPLFERTPGDEHSSLRILWRRAGAAEAQAAGEAPSDAPAGLWRTPLQLETAATAHPMLCVLGPSGCGKGHASLALATVLSRKGPCLLINGGFSFDTDSMLSGIAAFFNRHLSIAQRPDESRSRYFMRLAESVCATVKDAMGVLVEGGTLHIVLNGSERFFSINGHPLSGELDELMHMDIPCVSWTLFGTERVRYHAKTALRAVVVDFEDFYGTSGDRSDDENADRAAAAQPDGDAEEAVLRADRERTFVYMRDLLDKVSAILRKDGDHDVGEQFVSLSRGDWRVVREEIGSFRDQSAGRISGDSQHLRQAFFTWFLDGRVLAALLGRKTARRLTRRKVTLAQTILRQLCFFGLPVERNVLKTVDAILAAARDMMLSVGRRGEDLAQDCIASEPAREGGGLPYASPEAAVDAVLDELVEIGLVLRLAGYGAYRSADCAECELPRYALHRALLTELRSRFAIPLSEAKLSTAFNMSLYVAQPVDGYIPEPAMHDELGSLMESLMRAYRTVGDGPEAVLAKVAADHELDLSAFRDWLRKAADAAQSSEHPDERGAAEVGVRIHQLCGAKTLQRLRATLAVARGFYSTTGILTLDSGDRLIGDDRDGLLLEHAERLDRLVDVYAKTSLARQSLAASFAQAGLAGVFERIYSDAEPFYGDEIVWLHNERGVVRLAMGDLYEAKASFERAMAVNRKHVEYAHRDHNWRRIRLNQLSVVTEMGDIGLARRMAAEIVLVSRRRKPLLTLRRGRAAAPPEPELREDRLAIAIATGHLGWCSHLQGDDDKARHLYREAIDALADLEELRAQAFFTRLLVDVEQSGEHPRKDREAIEVARDLIQSTRQMDLIHRFQVSLASDFARSADADLQRQAYRMLEDALQYSLLADVYRVRCEASMAIARLRHRTGDYEGALRFASDALMVATRYGMELRKITLRTDIARTMAARGHPVTAQRLAKTAITVASRQRFHTAVRRAEKVLMEIPKMSAAIRYSDQSGFRKF